MRHAFPPQGALEEVEGQIEQVERYLARGFRRYLFSRGFLGWGLLVVSGFGLALWISLTFTSEDEGSAEWIPILLGMPATVLVASIYSWGMLDTRWRELHRIANSLRTGSATSDGPTQGADQCMQPESAE